MRKARVEGWRSSSSSSLDFWRLKSRDCAYHNFARVHVTCAQCTQKVGRTIGFVVSALLALSILNKDGELFAGQFALKKHALTPGIRAINRI